MHLFGAGVDSGTFDYFTEAINGKEKASRGDYTSSEDDNVIVQGVSRDRDAIGYFGYAYYDENKDKLKLVPIDDEKSENGAGPIAPPPESVRGGTYHPLFIFAIPRSSRSSTFLVWRRSPSACSARRSTHSFAATRGWPSRCWTKTTSWMR